MVHEVTDCNDGDFLLIKILLHLWKEYIVIVFSTAPTAKAAVHLEQTATQHTPYTGPKASGIFLSWSSLLDIYRLRLCVINVWRLWLRLWLATVVRLLLMMMMMLMSHVTCCQLCVLIVPLVQLAFSVDLDGYLDFQYVAKDLKFYKRNYRYKTIYKNKNTKGSPLYVFETML